MYSVPGDDCYGFTARDLLLLATNDGQDYRATIKERNGEGKIRDRREKEGEKGGRMGERKGEKGLACG